MYRCKRMTARESPVDDSPNTADIRFKVFTVVPIILTRQSWILKVITVTG